MRGTQDDRFAAAHVAGDTATVIALYLQAADAAAPDGEAFYLTQAYVTALEAGFPTETLLARLRALGAEP
ncbi:hypothetical protein [Tropicimonas sp. S265A]|uniref:hypothetical protein n=1 Tax=Tropicimonas sp. S265A TaxID=3415134 RepID=UPI003C7ACB93